MLLMEEAPASKRKRVSAILKRLRQAYPNIQRALHFSDPWQLLVATILSAQCTDKTVNAVTPALFEKYKTIKDYAEADPKVFSRAIKPTGFYKNKAKNILRAAKLIQGRFAGCVPDQLEDLTTLPGVGRKTANVVLGNAFDKPGLSVDTHMIRLNRLLKLTHHTDPLKIEFDLMKVVPEKDWTEYSSLIIRHGRVHCPARKPNCQHCEIARWCPSASVKV